MEHRWIQSCFTLSARLVSFEMPSESICSQSRSQQQRLWEGLTEGRRSEAEITYGQQLSKSKPDICNVQYSMGTEVCTHVDVVVGRNWTVHLCKSTLWPPNCLTCAIATNLCFPSHYSYAKHSFSQLAHTTFFCTASLPSPEQNNCSLSSVPRT